jgi:RNA polymerase sigma factor (sigma-70 family)
MLTTSDKPVHEDAEIERGIEALLSRLQQSDRDMLTMFHIEGRTARDVGQSFGLTEGNVRVRLMRSHRALRQHATALRADGIL